MRRTALARGNKPLRPRSKSRTRRKNDRRDAECREIVRARDGEMCRLCGRPGCDMVHCYSKGAHPEWRHELANLVWLCRECHNTAHRKPELDKRLKRIADEQRAEARSRAAAVELGELLGGSEG